MNGDFNAKKSFYSKLQRIFGDPVSTPASVVGGASVTLNEVACVGIDVATRRAWIQSRIPIIIQSKFESHGKTFSMHDGLQWISR